MKKVLIILLLISFQSKAQIAKFELRFSNDSLESIIHEMMQEMGTRDLIPVGSNGIPIPKSEAIEAIQKPRKIKSLSDLEEYNPGNLEVISTFDIKNNSFQIQAVGVIYENLADTPLVYLAKPSTTLDDKAYSLLQQKFVEKVSAKVETPGLDPKYLGDMKSEFVLSFVLDNLNETLSEPQYSNEQIKGAAIREYTKEQADLFHHLDFSVVYAVVNYLITSGQMPVGHNAAFSGMTYAEYRTMRNDELKEDQLKKFLIADFFLDQPEADSMKLISVIGIETEKGNAFWFSYDLMDYALQTSNLKNVAEPWMMLHRSEILKKLDAEIILKYQGY